MFVILMISTIPTLLTALCFKHSIALFSSENKRTYKLSMSLKKNTNLSPNKEVFCIKSIR